MRLWWLRTTTSLVHAWGGGEVASADGLRFVVPVRTIHAGPNPKYFGYERGVTYYNLVSDQFTGLNAIVVPGTLRDSLVLLAVVLEQPTELNPIEIMTDPGAYTDVVFGLFWLLGNRQELPSGTTVDSRSQSTVSTILPVCSLRSMYR